MNRLGLVLFVAVVIAGSAHAATPETPPPAPAAAGGQAGELPSGLHAALSGALARSEPGTGGIEAGSLLWDAQKVTASDGDSTGTFGYSVAISADMAIIGVQTRQCAYVFTRSGGTWVETQKLVAADGDPNGSFGTKVAMHGTRAVISSYKPITGDIPLSNSVYVFDEAGGQWTQSAQLMARGKPNVERFGQAVAVSGNTVLVGAYEATLDPYKPKQGAAYVFTESDGTWSLAQTLTPSDARASDQFGISVALSGGTALIGARMATLDRDVPQQGAAYVFEQTGESWTQTQKLSASDGGSGYYFGTAVAVDGDTALVGSPNVFGNGQWQGAAYVFRKGAQNWTLQQKLVSRNGRGGDQFGQSVALSGSTALVGAYGHGIGNYYQQGAAYAFVEHDGLWTQSYEFLADTPPVSAWVHFGWAVALDGDSAVVGAHLADVGGSMLGTAYFYTAHVAPTAWLGAPSLHFVLAPGETGALDLDLANLGDEPLDYVINASAAASALLAPEPPAGRAAATPVAGVDRVVGMGAIRGPRLSAPAPGGAAELDFGFDDGSYEDTITLNHGYEEANAIWLNQFAAPIGTGAFTLDSISIQWPQNEEGSLVGREVNLLVYYDARRLGDPSRAVRLGADHFVTIDRLDEFITYPVDFQVPGDGDIYVGFENSYARGDGWPQLYPAALDIDAPQGRSWLIGNAESDADPERPGNHDYLAVIDSFGLAGNWLIRATGSNAANDCIDFSAVPWLAIAPAQGSVEVAATRTLAISADATALELGDYSALLCVASNDPVHPLIRVPVQLSVGPVDRLFANGFEGAP